MVKRHELRESVFKLLFQLENSGMSLENIFNLDEEESYDAYVKDTVTSIYENKENIDKIISDSLKDWTIDRLSKMDRQILRIAIYEIVYSDIPYKVSINEAVELSKKYSEKDDSYKFVNGVLKGVVEREEK